MSQLDEIKQVVTKNGEGINKLLQWKATMNERCEFHKLQTAEMRKTIYGNPEDGGLGPEGGMLARINTLWNCKRNISRWKDFWMYILKVSIAAMVVAIASWLFLLYKGGLQ